MRKIILIAGIAALAACSKPAEVAPEATETAAAAPAAAASGAVPGAYDVTEADGTKSVTTLNADGTYVDTDAAGKETAKGKWATEEGKTCFTPDGGAKECYTDGAPGADGTFTATNSKGEVAQVKPQAAPAAAPAAK